MIKLYIKNVIKIMDEVDKILNEYVSTHNKKIDFFLFTLNLKYNLIIILPQI